MIQKNNLKNNVFRNATIAALDHLNRVIILQQHETDGIHEYPIKFFYDFKNDKQFIKDMFLELPHGCAIPSHAEGNFDISPKGTLILNNFVVKKDEITNRFVRATKSQITYDENNNPQKKAYSGLMFVMPMKLSYTLTLYSDSQLQMYLLAQEVLSQVYKNTILYYEYDGMRMPVQLYIGEDPNATLPTEFKWENDDEHRMQIAVSVETFLPVFDEKSLIFKGNRIHEFYNNIYNDNQEYLIRADVVTKDTVLKVNPTESSQDDINLG